MPGTGLVLSPADREIIQRTVEDVLGGKGYSQVPKARRRRFRANATDSPTGETFGILIADVDGITVTYSATRSQVTPGFAESAVIPLVKATLTGTGDTKGNALFKAELDDDDAQVVLSAVNPIWPTTLFAGITDEEDTPVIVRGYIDPEWSRSDGEGGAEDTTVFVITNPIFPVTIIKGLTQGAVAGGSATVDNLVTLWGRDPGVSSLTAINPNSWDSDDNDYALVMQKSDGTYQLIDLDCATP